MRPRKESALWLAPRMLPPGSCGTPGPGPGVSPLGLWVSLPLGVVTAAIRAALRPHLALKLFSARLLMC